MMSVDVSDIPIDCDTARLREHFEEETGCVDAISYLIHPLDGDPRRAIVAFRDSNAATYVANCCHQIGNATVQMTLRPRDMFTRCTVQVDSLVLVTCTPHIEQCLRAIETELGVRVERSAGVVTLIGTLPQIDSANSHLQKLWQHQVAHQERELQMIWHQSHHPDPWNDANMRQQLGEMPLTGLSGEIISSDSDTGRDRLRHRHGTEFLEHGNLHDQSGSSGGRISHHDVDRGLHDISSGSLQPEPPFVASMNACRGMEEVLRRAKSTPRFGSSDNFMGPNHQCNTESSIDQSTTGAISRAPDVAWVTSGSQSYQEDRCNGRVGRTSDPGTSSMEPSARTKEHDTGSRRRFSGDDCHSSGDAAYLSQWRDHRPPPAGHVAVPTTDILLEHDIAGYMRQAHALDLAAIENSLHVELKFEDIGDRIRVVISLPRPYDMLTENRGMAKTRLLDLCDRISTSVEKNRVYYRVDDITLPQMEELMSSVVHKFDRLSLQLICHGDLLVIGNHSQVRQASGMIKAHIEDQWRYPAEGANQYGNEEELFHTKSQSNSEKTTASISKRASKCKTNGNGYSQSKHTDHLENGRDEHLTRKTDPSGSKALKSSKSTKKTAIPKPNSYQAMEGSYSRVSSRQSNSYPVDTKWQSDVPTEIPQKPSNGTTRRGKFQFSVGGNLNVVICDGDITVETVDIIVSAANVHLANYSGVAGAISRAAGRQYEQDCIDYISKHGPLTVTGVVPMEISGPLSCRYVLHAVGPMWNLYEDKDRCSFDLRRTFYNCLCSADDLGAVSIALPAISTGIFMVPTDVCAGSLLAALQQFTSERPHDRSLDVVRIVNIDSEVTEIFAIILGQLLSADGHTVSHVDTTDHSSAIGRVGSSSRDNQHRKNNLGRGDRAIGDVYVSSSSESSPGGTACKFVSRRSLDSRVTAVKSCSRKSRSSLVDDDIPTGEVSQYRAPRSRPSSADRLQERESNRRRSASLDRHRSSEVLPGEQNRRPGDGSKSHSIQPHGNKQISKTLRQTLSRNRVASSSSSMPLRPSKATSRKTVASSIDSSESEVEKTDLEKCPICMDVMVLPKTLQKCGHRYCSHCIDAYFCHGKPICPVCGMVYGVLKGDQPEGGVMSWRIDHSIRLAGYVDSVGAIVIKYSFPDGVQQDHHPSPGRPYIGIKREAFLPNNVDGREVVALLKKAFNAGLVFTISDSRMTGRKDVITWNDIHHKTSSSGGAIGFGYPDPTYLDRVKDELAAKGITSLEGVKKPRSTSRLQ